KVGEEEGFVLSDRTTDRKTGLVALCVWFGVGLIEKIPGVQLRTLQEIPSAAVESVGAALHDDVYNGAAVVAELGRKAVVLDLEFLHALNQGFVVDVGIPALALFRRTDQSAIQPYFGGRVPLAVRGKVRPRGIVVRRAGPGHLRHARREEGHAEETAVREREFLHVLAGNVRAQRRAVRIQNGLCGRDVHRGRYACHLQTEVQRGLLIDRQDHTRLLRRAKTGSFDLHRVAGRA